MLLERTRKINKLLQSAGKVAYDEVASGLSSILEANIYIANRDGKILGYSLQRGFECEVMMDRVLQHNRFPEWYVGWLAKIVDTSPNIRLVNSQCAFSENMACIFQDKFTTIVPIYGAGERIGTLIVAKFNVEFTEDDLLLAEYGATIVGMEILRERSEVMEEEAREKAIAQVAIGSLSYSELDAVKHILGALDNTDGILVASQIADRVGITRSVIVNALRKLESAGVIETRSLGMKGTYIKILSERLLTELHK